MRSMTWKCRELDITDNGDVADTHRSNRHVLEDSKDQVGDYLQTREEGAVKKDRVERKQR